MSLENPIPEITALSDAEQPAVVAVFKVGRYVCEVTIPQLRDSGVQALSCEWSPHVPETLTPAELATYQSSLAQALRQALGAFN